MIKRWIEVQVIKEGIHRYPDAEKNAQLADVSYLANPHFHYFYITVKIEVFHNDRCIEFQQFRRYLDRQFAEGVITLDYKSCEMLAEDLIEVISTEYPYRDMKIRVFEDNINGCELEYMYTREI